jgi:hypothetical protein
MQNPAHDSAQTIRRRTIAQRVADQHAALAPGALTAMLFGSTVDGLADERSDIDMAIVFDALPREAQLAAACAAAGGKPWTWQHGDPASDDGFVVGFDVEGIEVQIAYTDPRILQGHLDKLLVAHEPDTPYHKVGEGLMKAQPLIGPERLATWRAQVAAFPAGLGDAMMRHYVGQATPWKWFALLQRRDAALWLRELLVDACYRQFGMLAGLNHRYFTTFQFKRMHRFATALPLAPARLADRVETLLVAPLPQAFAELHALEGEVLALLAAHAPHIDCSAAHERRTRFEPG